AMAPPQAKRLSPGPSTPAATASHTARISDQKSAGSGMNQRYPVDAPTPGSASGATSARSHCFPGRPSESANASTSLRLRAARTPRAVGHLSTKTEQVTRWTQRQASTKTSGPGFAEQRELRQRRTCRSSDPQAEPLRDDGRVQPDQSPRSDAGRFGHKLPPLG